MGRIGPIGLVYLVLACACGGAEGGRRARTPEQAAPAHPHTAGRPVAPALTMGTDVTERERTRNAASFRGPPTVFRRIEISQVPPAPVTRIENGFRIDLPGNPPAMTPAVYEGMLVFGGGFRSRTMYAVRAKSGDPVWSIGLGDDGPSTPACEDDVCVFNTESCTIFAVDADEGGLLWSWYIGDPLMSAPAIANGLVFASYPIQGGGGWPPEEQRPPPEGASHALAAFDLRTGELRWAKWIDADVISAPVAILDQVYATTFAGTIYQFDQQSGELAMARDAAATSAPTWIDGALYFTRRVDQGDASTEQIIRSGDTQQAGPSGKRGRKDGAAHSAPRAAPYLRYDFQEDSVYAGESAQNDAANGFGGGAPAAANAGRARALIGRATVHGLQEYQGSWVLGLAAGNFATMGDAVVSFDRQTGRQRWSVTLPGDLAAQGGALGAPPAGIGNRLVVATLAGRVIVLDAARGEVQRTLEAGAPLRTQAVVDDGWIYAGTANGRIVAIDTGDRTLTGWPTWAANPARTGQR